MDRNRGLDINALRQQLEDLLEEFLPAPSGRRHNGGRGGDQTQHLALNVLETDEAFVLSAPLPGFQPEDVDITVRGQNVALRAQHKTTPPEQENLTRHEWGQGIFQRSFELPGAVEAEQASATFRQGVVTVTLPKAAATEVTVETTEAEPQAEAAPEASPEEAEAAGREREKSSFYMAPGRGRRGRRHAGQKNQEAAPADGETAPDAALPAEETAAGDANAEEQAAGAFEASAEPSEAQPAENEGEARAKDQEQQSSFGTNGDGDDAASPVEESLPTTEEATEAPETVAEAVGAPDDAPAAEASDVDAAQFAEEAERAAEPPVE